MQFRYRRGFLTSLGLAAALSVVMVFPALAATTTVTVTPSNMQGWVFCNDQVSDCSGATGSLVAGPASPPLGVGSARLLAPTTSAGQALILAAYQGTKLADITQLQYSTFVTSGGPPQVIALQFNVDSDLTDSLTNYQGRLVFEPYHTPALGAVQLGAWQTWNPLQGRWWGSGTSTLASPRPISAACPQSNPCTWQDILEDFPNAGIHATAGAVVFKAGSGWSNFDGNVDALTIGVKVNPTTTNTTTFNFEPTVGPPTNKDQCKGDGWKQFNTPTFKNQGDCVSSVASDGRSR